LCQFGFRLPGRLFIAGEEWGQSGRWTSKSETKCNELRWSFLESVLDGKFLGIGLNRAGFAGYLFHTG